MATYILCIESEYEDVYNTDSQSTSSIIILNKKTAFH